jgi:hypothetical protein
VYNLVLPALIGRRVLGRARWAGSNLETGSAHDVERAQ